MVTYWCFDVSGSVSSRELRRAASYVREHIGGEDRMIVFDARAAWLLGSRDVGLSLLEDDLVRGHGGTDVAKCIELIESDGPRSPHRKVLLSDGLMTPEDLARFDEFVDLTKE